MELALTQCFNAVSIDPNGEITVTTHAVEMGNGSLTTFAIATADILGANAHFVKQGEISLFKQLQMVESFEPHPENPRWTPLLFMSSKAATTSSRWGTWGCPGSSDYFRPWFVSFGAGPLGSKGKVSKF